MLCMSMQFGGHTLTAYITVVRLFCSIQCLFLVNQKPITKIVFTVSFNRQKLMETVWEFFQGDIKI